MILHPKNDDFPSSHSQRGSETKHHMASPGGFRGIFSMGLYSPQATGAGNDGGAAAKSRAESSCFRQEKTLKC
jgi:hypothetical protein